MKLANINLGSNVEVDPTSSLNNIKIGDQVKIAKNCTLFGNPNHLLEIGVNSYVGMNAIIEGFNGKIVIGNQVSIAQQVTILSGSGPNASITLQKIFPIVKGEVFIDDHCWIGAGVTIMPGVRLGKFCVVAVNSFVNKSFPDFSVIGGCPAMLIRTLSDEEKRKLVTND